MRGLKEKLLWGSVTLVAAMVIVAATALITKATAPPGGFALQVSPSPLVATLKPGTTTDLDLGIRNQGSDVENLKIEPRQFAIDKDTGEVKLEDKVPTDVENWVSFSRPTFTINPGELTNEKVRISLPKDAGFSYSFALLISRAGSEPKVPTGNTIRGSVAVFTLINVDRPGAVRKFDVTNFKATQSIFEYLPADFDISFKNTGNTIVQPSGNVFIQRGSDDKHPITTLPVNNAGGYLLPNSPRTLRTSWDEGFPVYRTTTADDGKQKQELTWNWAKLTDFRFGQYTAKLVAFYNDGHSDIPVIREITFWVIPWRAILLVLIIIVIAVYVIYRLIQRKTRRAVEKALASRDRKKSE